jgi:hypothetical protein
VDFGYKGEVSVLTKRETKLNLTGGGIIHHTRVNQDKRAHLYGTTESKR